MRKESLKKLCILIAENDMEDFEEVHEALREFNRDVDLVHVRNGKEVMDYLDACAGDQLPSLVVLDFNMPMVNGLEVLVKMGKEARYQELPKVMYTTSNAPFHRSICLQAGAREYFVKPNDYKELPGIVRNMVQFMA